MDTIPPTKEERLQKLLALTKVLEEGWGGTNKKGQLVDRREDPDASIIIENSFLKIGKPKYVTTPDPRTRH
jgi:hypothetical protein